MISDVAQGETEELCALASCDVQGQHRENSHNVAWSPVSDKLASGSNDRSDHIWDAQTYQSLGQKHDGQMLGDFPGSNAA